MESRNPYAAPTAPVVAAADPAPLPAEAGPLEYAGFWRRVGALLLDGLITAPMGLGFLIGLSFTHNAYIYYALPSVLVFLFFHVYLVQRFGGTPGKRILNMRIAMLDGSRVTTKAAFIRYSPMLILSILSALSGVMTSLNLAGTGFEDMGFLQKMQALESRAPSWNDIVTWGMQAWWIIGVITLVANARKRAIHDFLAGTVVLREG